MNPKKWRLECSPLFAWLWLGIGMLGAGVYFFWLRELAGSLLEGNAPAWFEATVNNLYPRFTVERKRFSAIFFLQKADQVVIRAALLWAVFFLFGFVAPISTWVRAYWQRGAATTVGRQAVSVFRVIFYLSMLGFTKDWLQYLLEYGKARAFYKPTGLLGWFSLPFPTETVIYFLFFMYALSIILVVFNKWAIKAAILVAVLFFLQLNWLQSFEKISHTYATFGYAVVLMPLLVHQAKNTKGEHVSGWPLFYIRLSIAAAYFFSGMEKLLISGLQWPSAGTLAFYLSHSETDYSSTIGLPLLWVSSVLVLLWQLSFPLAAFLPKHSWIWLVGGVLFHFSTVLLMGIGAIINPWLLMYMFFLEGETYSFLKKQFF